MLVWGPGSEYMGGTRGLASAGDVLEMSVVRGVGGVCDICMCLARGWRCWGEWVTGMGLGFTNSGETWGKWDMCLCFGCAVVSEDIGWATWDRVWEGGIIPGCVVSLDSLC